MKGENRDMDPVMSIDSAKVQDESEFVMDPASERKGRR